MGRRTVRATAFLPPAMAPLRAMSRRPPSRRAPPAFTTTAQPRLSAAHAAPAGIRIRVAERSDVQAMSTVTARAFIEDDDAVRDLWRSLPPAFARGVTRALVAVSALEVRMQLRKRLPDGTAGEDGAAASDGKRRDAHAALVAVDSASEQIVGCVEVGLIDIAAAREAPVSETARLWEETADAVRESKADGSVSLSDWGIGSDTDTGTDTDTDAETGSGSDARPAGWAGQGRAPYMGNLAVAAKFRRRGVGAALVAAAREQATGLWRDGRIWLHVDADNGAAVRMYRRLGFACEATEPAWCRAVGRRPRLLLRAGEGAGAAAGTVGSGPKAEADEAEWRRGAKQMKVKLNPLEYVRWCFYDLAHTRREGER